MEYFFHIFFPLFTAFIITFLSIPKIIHFSNKTRLFAEVGDRNSHIGKIPILGGVAIFSGFLFSIIFWSEFEEIKFMLISIMIIFFIGILDDLLPLSPKRKLFGIILSVLVIIFLGDLKIDSFHNLFGIQKIPNWISIIFTIFVVVVITNSYNLIDGIDGLAGGLGTISSIAFGLIFYFSKDLPYSIISFALSGALLAFLKYNFNPASIFMGDTGSLVIGLILSVLSIRLINKGIDIPIMKFYQNKGPFVAIVLLAIPLYDTFRVFFVRILSRNNPLYADRNHIHHLLLDLGLGHRNSTIILYIFSIVIIVISYFMISLSLGLSIFILTIIILSSMGIPFIFLKKNNKPGEK